MQESIAPAGSGIEILKGHDFKAYGKRHPELGKVSGHDFSRAANSAKYVRALQAAEKLAAARLGNKGTTSVGPQMPPNKGGALAPAGSPPVNSLSVPCFSAASVSIHRQSRWLYGCWPLKEAFSQPSEAKARTKAKTSSCCLHRRTTGNSRENILPEFSKFYCHPGRAGGSPLTFSPCGIGY